MAGYIYDVECYSNFFCASFIEIKTKLEVIDNYCKADWKKDIDLKQSTLKELNIKTFIICNCDNYEINQVEELCKFVKDECIILVGYNNRNYDDLMLDYLLNGTKGCLFWIERPRVTSSVYSRSSPKPTPIAIVLILISKLLSFLNR